jgi:predicted CoA-binding protein
MSTATDETLDRLLGAETVAVVGCSSTPGKDAHEIPKYLLEAGYDVVPVNPNADEIFGRRAYDRLGDVETGVDVVDVFRPSDEVAGIVDQVLDRRADRGDVRGLWLQLGIRDDEAAARAEAAGVTVVQDRCMKVEHRRLRG